MDGPLHEQAHALAARAQQTRNRAKTSRNEANEGTPHWVSAGHAPTKKQEKGGQAKKGAQDVVVTAMERKKNYQQEEEAAPQRGQEHVHHESTEEVEDVKPTAGRIRSVPA